MWPDNVTPAAQAIVQFASYIFFNQTGAQYEVAFSKCKGDFSYYKTNTATVAYPGSTQVFQPCGVVWGTDMSLAWSRDGAIDQCRIPAGEQWYMNWRVSNCPTGTGHTCGQTFYVPRG
jgi:hypothetical protein